MDFILIGLIVLLVIIIISGIVCTVTTVPYKNDVIICPNGTNYTDLGGPTIPAGCYCPYNNVWVEPFTNKEKLCVSCIGGSNINYQGGVTANITGCMCTGGYGYTGQSCMACLGGSNPTNTSGVRANIPVCYCPNNYQYYLSNCTECIGGSNPTYTTGIPASNNCYCPQNRAWVNNTLCMTCLDTSTTTAPAQPWVYANGITGCYCPTNNQWYQDKCTLCQGGSNPTYTSGVPASNNCYCPFNNSWVNNTTCIQCAGNSTTTPQTAPWVYANGVTGCYCPTNNQWYLGNCTGCIGGSNPTNTSGVPATYGCYCPTNYAWEYNTTCTQCKGGSTTTAPTLPWVYANVTGGCYCPTNYAWVGASSTCMQCMSGSTVVNSVGSTPAGVVGCFCPTGQAWSNTLGCVGCPQGSNTSPPVAGQKPTNTVGCYCPLHWSWEPNFTPPQCVACAPGADTIPNTPSNTTITNPPTTGCWCQGNSVWLP
jgi:hypothetical protein